MAHPGQRPDHLQVDPVIHEGLALVGVITFWMLIRKSTIPLVSSSPLPGTTTAEANPPVKVRMQATMVLSRSRMLKWVVQSTSQGAMRGPALLLQLDSLAVDGACDLLRVCSRPEPAQRHRVEVKVRAKPAAVSEGYPRHFCEQMQVLRLSLREAAQVEILQDSKCLQVCKRAGRHRGAEQLLANVGGPDGIEHLCIAFGEFLRAQGATFSPDLIVGGSHFASIQGVLALPADPFEGIGQVALNDSFTERRGISVRQEYARHLHTGSGWASSGRSSGRRWGLPRTLAWRSGPPAPAGRYRTARGRGTCRP